MLSKLIKKEEGYTLIELLLTIFIVSIILLAVTTMLIQILRVGQRADLRRNVRQDLELSLDVLRRDFRNADSALTLQACNGTSETPPKMEFQLVKADAPDTLDITLSNSLEKVNYSIVTDEETGVRSLIRNYDNGLETSSIYLTTDEMDITSFKVTCSRLLQENKFLLVEVHADSSQQGKNGKIVKDVTRYTGVTIRNTAN